MNRTVNNQEPVMKNNHIRFIVACILLSSVTRAYSTVVDRTFRQLVEQADAIVEGVVKEQADNACYDRESRPSFRKKSAFAVSRVHKGDIDAEHTIAVFSHMYHPCDMSCNLTEGSRYLLMLKEYDSGFADVHYGRGVFEIVADESTGKVMIKGKSYEEFVGNIAWALAGPSSWPQESAVSYDEARQIALRELAKSDIQLTGLELLPNARRPHIRSMDVVGIGYRGDPVWRFRAAASGGRSAEPWDYVYCSVHAHTGAYNHRFVRRKGTGSAKVEPDTANSPLSPSDMQVARDQIEKNSQRQVLDHTSWIAGIMKDISTITVGMKREQLDKVFATEGGLYTRQLRTYVHRQCPYIKVDVEFRPVGSETDVHGEGLDDRIVKLSKPYLQWSISD